MTASRWWRITRPLRAATGLLRKVSALGRRGDSRRLSLDVLFDADWYARDVRQLGRAPPSSSTTISRPAGGRAATRHRCSTGMVRRRSIPPDRPRADVSPLEDFVAHPYDRRPNRWFDPMIWRRFPDLSRPRSLVALPRGACGAPWRFAIERGCPSAPVGARRGARKLEGGCAAHVYVHYDPGRPVRRARCVGARSARGSRASRRRLLYLTCARRRDPSDALLEHVAYILSVPNTGHDWGAYHAGLRFSPDECNPRSLTFMNDSVYVVEDAPRGLPRAGRRQPRPTSLARRTA